MLLPPMSPMRKYAAAALGSVVLAAGLTSVAPAANAVPASAAVSDGEVWLASQLTGGLVHNDQYGFDDYGTSIDVALALQAMGDHAHDTDVASIATAVGNHIAGSAGYTEADEYDFNPPYAFVQHGYYANATAKALVFAQATGQDTTTYGGVNLVTKLEDRVVTTGDRAGRIQDDSFYGDYGNTIGQAFAVQGLTTAASPQAAAVETWLLAQQCPGGGFSLNMGGTTTSCTTNSDADPDVTSYVLIILNELSTTDAKLARAVGKAEAWLLGRQHVDGSFNGGSSTDYPNANSTGLAGWALGDLGDTGAATAAATWLRQHQVQPLAACPSQLATEGGAIAYDDAALAAGRVDGITTQTRGQWRSASSQAVPALRWAPTGTSTPVLTAPTTYVPAGGKATVKATGVTPGSWVCGSVGSSHVPSSANAAGAASITVKVPAGSGNRTVTLNVSDDTSATALLKALAAKALTVTVAKAAVPHGRTQTVRTSGLAAGEPVKVFYNGRVIKTAKATASGAYALTFAVGTAKGTKTVKIQGAFANRVGSKTFKVS